METIILSFYNLSVYKSPLTTSPHCLAPDTQYSSMPGKIRAAVQAKTEATTESNHRYAQVAAAISLGNMTGVWSSAVSKTPLLFQRYYLKVVQK